MNIYISGNKSHLEAMTFSEKGYGKPGGHETSSFVLEVEAADFLRRFTPIYDGCIAELRRDDEITGVFHPPFQGAKDYPTLDEILQESPENRMELIGTYLVFDILRLYLAEDATGEGAKWLVWRCDSVDRHDDVIIVRGMVRARPI